MIEPTPHNNDQLVSADFIKSLSIATMVGHVDGVLISPLTKLLMQ